MKKKIFISHPYSNNPTKNKQSVESICKWLLTQGVVPISPLHMFSFYEEDVDREVIMDTCKHLINMSDEVWIYGNSSGCMEEMRYAFSNGKHIEVKYASMSMRDISRAMANYSAEQKDAI